MTGIELLKEFRKMAPEIPVVMFSGSSDETLAERALREGAAYFLSKPAENAVIVTAVQKAIGI